MFKRVVGLTLVKKLAATVVPELAISVLDDAANWNEQAMSIWELQEEGVKRKKDHT